MHPPDGSCIDDVNAAGVYGAMSWTAGTTYYILLDDENSTTGTHTFYINCPCATPTGLAATPTGQTSATLDWNDVPGSSGYEVRYKPSSTSTWPAAKTTTGSNYTATDLTCGTTYNWQVRTNCGGGGYSEWSNGTDFTTSECPTPCSSITNIDGCGSTYEQTYTGGGAGAWNTSFCGYSTPGTEKIYQFTAPSTGTYNIQVTAASGFVDYGWKEGSCAATGWTCISDITRQVLMDR